MDNNKDGKYDSKNTKRIIDSKKIPMEKYRLQNYHRAFWTAEELHRGITTLHKQMFKHPYSEVLPYHVDEIIYWLETQESLKRSMEESFKDVEEEEEIYSDDGQSTPDFDEYNWNLKDDNNWKDETPNTDWVPHPKLKKRKIEKKENKKK